MDSDGAVGDETNRATWSEEQPGRPTVIRTDWFWRVNIGVMPAEVDVETFVSVRPVMSWEMSA